MNALSQYLSLGLGALFLREDAFEKMREDARPFIKGLVFILLVAVVAALVGIVGKVLEWSVQPNLAQIQQIVLEELQKTTWFRALTRSPQALEQFQWGYSLWWQFFGPLLQVSLPGAIANVVLSPLGLVLRWVIYGVFAYLFARLLGGTASLAQLLGCTALSVAPEMFRVLQAFPFVQLAGLSVWGLLCTYVGIKVSTKLSPWRAWWATLLPFIMLALVALLFGCIGGAVMGILLSGGRS